MTPSTAPRSMRPFEIFRAVTLYEQGMTIAEVAEHLDRCRTGIYLALQEHGVQMRRTGPRKEPAMADKKSKPSTNSGVQHAKQRQQSPPGGPRDQRYDDKHNPDYDDKNLNSDGK